MRAGPARLPAVLAAAALVAVSAHPALAQCPMCRTGLESPEAAALAAAFNRGILFLLAVPFVSVAAVAGMVWVSARRAGRPQPSAGRTSE
ncbi:MAG: hypothetical protein R3190_01525 [Thermoanaerobaculia bacterium]|nr:hypothetical protein [Thermoanaerobaculia bacterium]